MLALDNQEDQLDNQEVPTVSPLSTCRHIDMGRLNS